MSHTIPTLTRGGCEQLVQNETTPPVMLENKLGAFSWLLGPQQRALCHHLTGPETYIL